MAAHVVDDPPIDTIKPPTAAKAGASRQSSAPRTGRSRARHLAVALAAGVAVLLTPSTAAAHGGISVAEGGSGGVRIAVQGSPAGPGQVDLATTLSGRGTGAGSKVVYWIRPEGRRRSVRVATQRDERGIHHAEIPIAGRGSWQDWDVAAYVTLSTGTRLRVTNDRSAPPGPPQRPDASRAARPEGRTTTAPSAPQPAASEAAVEDVSGEGDGAPPWVVPSLGALILVSALGVASLKRRRRGRDDR
ncbi:hypothetical protein SK069_17465 [Patulibacter brassicae]|jgi:hypothetical protein|uniref:Uncharacterized protein n=1 Tax=Patulibacter brassicae TaxID=1705717 RepID=A0ABU4VR20_9ACTN|nr:hypothetical protein [Patulibacter brassicae]MDX8153391.1 hypothetical protein [Patulibacter brassicae]